MASRLSMSSPAAQARCRRFLATARHAGRVMPVARNPSSLLAAPARTPGAWPAMLRAWSSCLLARVTNTSRPIGMTRYVYRADRVRLAHEVATIPEKYQDAGG